MSKYILALLVLAGCGEQMQKGDFYNEANLKGYNFILYHTGQTSTAVEMDGKFLCSMHQNTYIAIKKTGHTTLSSNGVFGSKVKFNDNKKHYINVERPANSGLAVLTMGAVGGDYHDSNAVLTEIDYQHEKPLFATLREACRVE